jgi:hypothetical protein
LRNATGLIRLTSIDAGVANGCWRAWTILSVMFLVVDMLARLILFPMQIATFAAGQTAVRSVFTLELTDVTLLVGKPPGFTPREFPGPHALLNTITLVMLTRVHTRIARAAHGVGVRCGRGGNHPRDQRCGGDICLILHRVSL